MPTVTVVISPSSSKSLTLITIAQTSDKTDTSLSSSFNQTVTTKTISPASSTSLAIITMAQTSDKTDSSLTTSFNTTFNLQVTELLTISLAGQLTIPDVRPIIFHTRTSTTMPITFYTRSALDTLPIVFYSHGPFILLNKTDTSLSAEGNLAKRTSTPTFSATATQSIVTMAQSSNKTDSSLTADWSHSIA